MISIYPPSAPIKSAISISGSKSISNRLLILKSVLKADILTENLSDAEDTQLLIKALETVQGQKEATIDVHHAGTDMRFLTALLCITEGSWTLTGSERLKQRPIAELVRALNHLGAEISFLEKDGFPPLQIKGKALEGGRLIMDGSISSQFISAVLLIAPTFKKGLKLELKNTAVSKPYLDMTIALLEQLNVKIDVAGPVIRVEHSGALPLSSLFYVESDWSSASYWYSICALSENAELKLSRFTYASLQADSVLPQLYSGLGVHTEFKDDHIFLSRKEQTSASFTHDFTNCPDIAQTLAATCTGLGIEASLTGLQTLKIKETDRILAMRTELEKIGAVIEAGDHSLSIKPASKRTADPVSFSTYADHRMAMSLAPLALRRPGLIIEDPQVVDKSYPRFWRDLQSVGFNVHLQP